MHNKRAHTLALAFLKLAFRGTFWHGTSSKFLREILKVGLSPDPKTVNYSGEWATENKSMGRSFETYGGVYVTDKAGVAVTYADNASSSQGGHPLLVKMVLETRTPGMYPDEDIFLDHVGDSLGVHNTSHVSLYPNLFDKKDDKNPWKALFRNLEDVDRQSMPHGWIDPKRYDHAAQLIETANIKPHVERALHDMMSGADNNLKSRFHQQYNALFPLMDRIIRAHAIHLLDQQFDDLKTRAETASHMTDAQKMHMTAIVKPHLLENSLATLKTTINAFHDKAKWVSDFMRDKKGEHMNLRSQEPVTFSGSNRIEAIVEFVPELDQEQGDFTTVQTHWGDITADHDVLDKFVTPYRILDVKGKLVHANVGGKSWPTDLWGPQPDSVKIDSSPIYEPDFDDAWKVYIKHNKDEAISNAKESGADYQFEDDNPDLEEGTPEYEEAYEEWALEYAEKEAQFAYDKMVHALEKLDGNVMYQVKDGHAPLQPMWHEEERQATSEFYGSDDKDLVLVAGVLDTQTVDWDTMLHATFQYGGGDDLRIYLRPKVSVFVMQARSWPDGSWDDVHDWARTV